MDDDDEDYSGFDKEEEEARARLSKMSTTSSRPASSARPGGSLGGMGAKKMSNASATSDGWGSEDMDEAFAAPAPAAQRRPMNSGGHVSLGAKKLGAKPLKLGAKKVLSAKDIDLESMLG